MVLVKGLFVTPGTIGPTRVDRWHSLLLHVYTPPPHT